MRATARPIAAAVAEAAAAAETLPTGGKLGKLLRLRRVVRNWPRTLLDHLRLSRADYVCGLRDGSSFEVRGGTDDRHILFELFVEGVYPVQVSPGEVVVDVGAHIGGFTVWAARRGARVLAFEPFAANFERLRRNVERNGVQERVRLFPLALSGRREERAMYLPDDPSFSGRYSLHPGRGGATLRIPCRSLDEVVEEHGLRRLDLLKLDCQGSEYEILYGASVATIARTRAIVVECERFAEPAGWSVQGLQRFLEARGFLVQARGSVLLALRPGPLEAAS